MEKVKSIILLMLVALLPVQLYAEEAAHEGEELDIPEIVLEHLADAYEWHIASYQSSYAARTQDNGTSAQPTTCLTASS